MIDQQRFEQIITSLNDAQREAVMCDHNCVVTAGAGSGKTTVLSYRFLRLVIEGKAHVDEILTLTFSRLAAAEMFARIQSTLQTYRDDRDILQELGRFGEATITTIDAFCNRIVAADPLRYGFGGDFVMDEEANRLMATECARQLCRDWAEHPGVIFLATLYGPEELVDSLLAPLAVSNFHPSTTFVATEASAAVLDGIEQIYSFSLHAIIEASRAILELHGSTKTLIANQQEAERILGFRTLLEQRSDVEICLDFLTSVNMRKCIGKQDHVEPCNELVEQIRQSVRFASGACAALQDRSMIPAVYAVLGRLHDSYLVMKRERRILSFADIAHMAKDILLHNAQVRAFFQRRYRYIMIDEFQDTNQLQKDLIYLLAQDPAVQVDGVPQASELQSDKLFFVGDEKQSIYRFRGSDVRVFKQLDREIIRSGGRRIILSKNYRSEPQLIECFNTVFERVLGDAKELYQASFEPLEAREGSAGISPAITFLFKERALADSSDDDEETVESVQAEAHAIASLIHRMTDTDEYRINGEGGEARRPRLEEIAILLRTSGNQMHYEKSLRLSGIDYTLSAVQSLFLEAPANDLYLFLQLVLFPDDRLAFAGVLRSPFCRLSDDVVLMALDRMSQTGEAFPSIDDGTVDPIYMQKYLACSSLYWRICSLARTSSVATLVSCLWHEGGYRYHLLSDPLYQVYLEHFDYLMELAIQYDGREKHLSDFLDYLRPRLGRHEHLADVEPLRRRTSGVQIMTVHKSKGLEFPIVILANMGSSPRSMTTPAWHEPVDSNLSVPIPRHMRPYDSIGNLFFELDKPVLRAMETAEMKRLFYVALTRAKTHLVLSGCEQTQNMGEKAVDRNFLALFLHHMHALEQPLSLGPPFRVQPIAEAPVSVLRSSVPKTDINHRVDSMRLQYRHPRPDREVFPTSMAVTLLAPHREGGSPTMLPSLPVDQLIADHHLESVFGTWCHAIVQHVVQGGVQNVSPGLGLLEHVMRLMPAHIGELSLKEREVRALEESVSVLVSNLIDSSCFSELVSEGPLSFESEVGFSMSLKQDQLPPMIANGSIDLLVRYTDHVRVLDFKTDSSSDPARHEGQLTLYREAARRLYGLPVRSAICYLRRVDPVTWVTEDA